MTQSHHFIKIITRSEKISKKRSRLFITLNCNIYNTYDENHIIVISYCRFLLILGVLVLIKNRKKLDFILNQDLTHN